MNELLRRRILAITVLVNVAVFGGWIAREELSRRGGTVKLPVEGYDPRDLLSGHYVQFRLVAEREAQQLAKAQSYCVEELNGELHVMAPREDPDDCDRFITSTSSEQVDFGVRRFYVDERKASRVARVNAGPQTYLIATVDKDGIIHPVDLVVDGVSLKNF